MVQEKGTAEIEIMILGTQIIKFFEKIINLITWLIKFKELVENRVFILSSILAAFIILDFIIKNRIIIIWAIVVLFALAIVVGLLAIYVFTIKNPKPKEIKCKIRKIEFHWKLPNKQYGKNSLLAQHAQQVRNRIRREYF